MNTSPTDFREWQRFHYEIEKDYARKILLSPKNSKEREQLINEAYNRIRDIIEQYDPGGGETPYPVDFEVSIVRNLVKKGGHIFELGCGSGKLIAALIQDGYMVKGIDVANDCIKSAKERLRLRSSENCVEQADIINYEDKETYDCIVMDNVIEHIVPDSINDVLQKCFRMLNKQGCVIIITPHKYSGPHDISQHFLPLGAKAEGSHFREFSFTDLEEVLREAGFKLILGFPFHPRLLQKFSIVPRPSLWAAQKTKGLEKIIGKSFLSKILTINKRLTRAMVAILFPAVCVGVKTDKLKSSHY